MEAFIINNKSKKSAEKTVKIAPMGVNSKRKIAKNFPNDSQKFSVRLIKYTYNLQSYYMITSLQNKVEFPQKIFADLYHQRWGIEEAYKQLKVFLLRKEFHSSCYQTVCHEIFAATLVANMSRVLTMVVEEKNKDIKKNSKTPGNTKESSAQEFQLASKQVIRLFDDVWDCDIAI